jgi:hypothetical protein
LDKVHPDVFPVQTPIGTPQEIDDMAKKTAVKKAVKKPSKPAKKKSPSTKAKPAKKPELSKDEKLVAALRAVKPSDQKSFLKILAENPHDNCKLVRAWMEIAHQTRARNVKDDELDPLLIDWLEFVIQNVANGAAATLGHAGEEIETQREETGNADEGDESAWSEDELQEAEELVSSLSEMYGEETPCIAFVRLT